ncbi:holin [Burkholderia contaminans]|uniref:holin n=1 Tax=Burkholderia contaminans TaxID=488447 RepID=UPI0014535981|nr:holin [Burkholderia contaminans]VWD22526.1 holin [Burkholderia contaminans]
MQLSEHEKEILKLIVLGAFIGLGKVFVGGERLGVRLVLGRMIIGAGLSTSAGAALIMFNELSPTALVGVASVIGIMGQQALEAVVQRVIGKSSTLERK